MSEFRVASFNTLNLVRPGVKYYSNPAYTDEEHAEKVDWIADRLVEADAAIVGFQEIWHESSLEAACKASGLYPDLDRIVAPGTTPAENEDPITGKGIGPKVGLATSLPLLSHESIENFPPAAVVDLEDPTAPVQPGDPPATVQVPVTTFSRPVLKAQVELPDGTAGWVFVAHLKSKRPTYLDGEDDDDFVVRAVAAARAHVRRLAEAAALRALVVDVVHETDAPVIVLGDLNDAVPSVSTQLVAGEQPFFRLRRSSKERFWDVLLYSANDIQARQSFREHELHSHLQRARRGARPHSGVRGALLPQSRRDRPGSLAADPQRPRDRRDARLPDTCRTAPRRHPERPRHSGRRDPAQQRLTARTSVAGSGMRRA